MNFRRKFAAILLFAAALLLTGCGMRTVDQMYAVPKRSSEYQDLQKAIDRAMSGLEYSAPQSGENQQTVQMADLDGDGMEEYLLFARGNSDDPMKIFIFSRQDEAFSLQQTIKSRGAGFEFVEYLDIDENPGKELVVGLKVSDQVLRYLVVFSFRSDEAKQLLAVNYSKFVSADLDEDGYADLMVINPGQDEENKAVAALYRYTDGEMVRSMEARMSEDCDNIKRIMVSKLQGGTPAVYVASLVEESAIITDIFAMQDGRFSNISLSNESGTSVQTLRNHYVYAMDIDSDGTLELPSLMDMRPVQNNPNLPTQHLIRWFAMAEDGSEVDKNYTFHNLDGGWYFVLDGKWAPRISVIRNADVCTFYVWDADFEKAEKLMTVYAFTGSDREMKAVEENRFIVYKSDSVVYAVKLDVAALSYGVTEENLEGRFHLIHLDWKSGET